MAKRSFGGMGFDGPYSLPVASTYLRGKAGVYLIVQRQGLPEYLDIDHAEDVGAAVADHERRSCWLGYDNESRIGVLIHETDSERQRVQDEAALREGRRFPCRPAWPAATE